MIMMIVSEFAGLIEDCDGCQYSALVGLHDVTIHYHLIQYHVGSVNVEHDLFCSTAWVKGRYRVGQSHLYIYVPSLSRMCLYIPALHRVITLTDKKLILTAKKTEKSFSSKDKSL